MPQHIVEMVYIMSTEAHGSSFGDVYPYGRRTKRSKKGCGGTIDNLLIDRMVTQHCHRGRRNLSMGWIVANGDHGLRM